MILKQLDELLVSDIEKRYLEAVFEKITDKTSLILEKTALSVSKLIHKLSPKFDSDGLALDLSKRVGHEMYGKTVEEIQKLWSEKTNDAASTGTSIDKLIQRELHAEKLTNLELMQLNDTDRSMLLQFRKLNDLLESFGIFGIGTQIRVANEHILGFLDELYYGRDNLFLIDFKTYSDLDKAARSYDKYLLGPLSSVSASKLSAATTQLFLYKYLLETEYGLRIAGCRLFNIRTIDYTILYPTYKYDAELMKECIQFGLTN